MVRWNATKSLEQQKDKHRYNFILIQIHYTLRNVYKVPGIVLSAFCVLPYVVLKTTHKVVRTKNNKNSVLFCLFVFFKYPDIPNKDYFEKQILADLPVT